MERLSANAESHSSSRPRRDSSPTLENVVPYSKRKADGAHVASSQKRRRLDLPTSSVPSVARLPWQVWQHVFLYLHPVTLGRLLRVNRAFYTLLTSVDEPSSGSQHLSALPVLSSNFIWLSARKIHFPTFPRPLMDMSELAMWRLLGGRRCQFCAKTSRHDQSWAVKSAFEDGPGLDGVRIVWPFGVRVCGRCLEAHSQTEQSLLFAVNSALLAALPYVFVTQHLHVVPSTVIGSTSSVPPSVKIAKWYWRDHVRDIQRQFDEARSLGPAAGEEWLKGLEDVGRQRLVDAERWERWERTRGMQESGTSNSKSNSPAPLPPSNGHQRQSSPFQMARQLPMNGVPRAVTAAQYAQQYSGPSTDRHMSPQNAPSGVTQRFRPERNIRDANEAKAARKYEIERRCQDFDPPLLTNVLRHMKAFQAACQISAPLTEKAWEMLKPRLEAERKGAEDVEHERAAQMATLQIKLEDRRHQDASLKEVREVLEREWEEVQRPVRERLGAYADEIIQRDWAEGRGITMENCPQFAAELLMEVRSRFYADQARADDAALVAGQEIKDDPPTGPPTRRLILENMKWVFDNKVKPRTEQYRKELFLCSGDGCEGNPKWYGFEGIIQHFGAKHTTLFSVGNVVVCWKEADWPEEPPFHPDPARARHGFYNNGITPSGPAHLPHPYPYPYPGYVAGPVGAPPISHTPHPLSQNSPVPFGQYGQPTGPFPPPQAPPPAPFYGPPGPHSQSFAPPPGPVPAYAVPPQVPWQDGSYSHDVPQQFQGPIYSPTGTNFAPPTGPVAYGDSVALRYGAPAAVVPGSYGSVHGRPPYDPPATFVATTDGSSAPKIYQDQIQAFVDVARDLWTSTSGIKHLTPSVRLSVVIYHILYHFNLRFGIEPSLDLFADALDAHHSMYPINAVSGLRCKACVVGLQNHAPHIPSSSHELERNFPTLLSLILHFKSEHIGGVASSSREQSPESRYDWKKDMIDLPEEAAISALIQSPGMDDNKLRIIADAFPKLFPSPLPHIGVVTEEEHTEATRPAENLNDSQISTRPSALAPDRNLISQGSHLRSAPATEHDLGRSPASRSSTLAPPPVSSGVIEHHDGQNRLPESQDESRLSRRYHDRSFSPPAGDRRRRVYLEEPAYYVSRDYRDVGDRDFDRAWRDPYGPLSPAAVRRYSHYGRMYEDDWERAHASDRYYLEREQDPRERAPTRSGLRYLDRPEFSAGPSQAENYESRPRDLERTDMRTISREPPTRTSTALNEEADAERFLNDLDRDQDQARGYVSRAARDEAREDAEDRMRQPSRAPEEPTAHPVEDPNGNGANPNADRPGALNRNGRETWKPDPTAGRAQVPLKIHYRDEEEYRPSAQYDPEPRRYNYGPSRYRRYNMYHEEPYYEPERLVRARSSRFSRYEATRRRLEQSKSPARQPTAQPERPPGSPSLPPPPSERTRDEPQPHGREAPPRDYYYRHDERDRYSQRPPSPLVDYRYTEIAPSHRPARSGPAYVNEYGEYVEYVRVRDPYRDPYHTEHRRRYITEAPVARPPAPPSHRGGDPRLARYYEYAEHDLRDPRKAGRFDYHRGVVEDEMRYAYERDRDYRDRSAYYERPRVVDAPPVPRGRESVIERDFESGKDPRSDFYEDSVGPPETVPLADDQRERGERRESIAATLPPLPPQPARESEVGAVAGGGRGREDGGEE